jgi:hypothetical protein
MFLLIGRHRSFQTATLLSAGRGSKGSWESQQRWLAIYLQHPMMIPGRFSLSSLSTKSYKSSSADGFPGPFWMFLVFGWLKGTWKRLGNHGPKVPLSSIQFALRVWQRFGTWK